MAVNRPSPRAKYEQFAHVFEFYIFLAAIYKEDGAVDWVHGSQTHACRAPPPCLKYT